MLAWSSVRYLLVGLVLCADEGLDIVVVAHVEGDLAAVPLGELEVLLRLVALLQVLEAVLAVPPVHGVAQRRGQHQVLHTTCHTPSITGEHHSASHRRGRRMGHIVVLAKRTGMSRVDLVSASHSLAAMR